MVLFYANAALNGLDKDYIQHDTNTKFTAQSFVYFFRRIRKMKDGDGNYFSDKRKGEVAIRQVPSIVDRKLHLSISSGTNYGARRNKKRRRATSLG